MTLAELKKTVPSGFPDSALKNLAMDYERRIVRLDLSLSVGDPDGPHEQRDDVRDAEAEISGVAFVVIDPPSPSADYDFNSPGEICIADSYQTRSIPAYPKSIDPKLLDRIPAGALAHSFFVIHWNSYIHFAAKDCAIRWVGSSEHCEGPIQHSYPGESIHQ